MEIAENKLSESGYLKEGTLTVFSGVPFGKDEPYNYLSAKRILKLAMEELRKRKELASELGMDLKTPGRGMIKGKQESSVWDYLSLKKAGGKSNFTKYPHFTLSIQAEKLYIFVAVPHRINPKFRKSLVNLGKEGFAQIILEITRNVLRVYKNEKRAAPVITLVQRRYPSQSSPPIIDARIEYDMRTAFDIDRSRNLRVRQQFQWLDATYDALKHKRSNLQIALGASIPYQYCKVQKDERLLDYIVDTWIACKPLVDAMKVLEK